MMIYSRSQIRMLNFRLSRMSTREGRRVPTLLNGNNWALLRTSDSTAFQRVQVWSDGFETKIPMIPRTHSIYILYFWNLKHYVYCVGRWANIANDKTGFWFKIKVLLHTYIHIYNIALHLQSGTECCSAGANCAARIVILIGLPRILAVILFQSDH